MKKLRWIAFLVMGAMALGACGPTGQTEPPPTEPPPTCDPRGVSGPATERYRAWILFSVEDPRGAAAELSSLLTEGGDDFIVVRADVIEGDFSNGDFNLVIPVDAADDTAFGTVLADMTDRVGSAPTVLHVTDHYPLPPHCSHTFIAEEEFKSFPLPEYDPPGRHPQSPGANPWG